MPTRLSTQASQSGEETRAKIIAATLQTLRDEGIVGATARAIARTGGFNQALIFYHFGGVTGLLVAAAVSEGQARAERYAPRLESVTTLAELVAVARDLHEAEVSQGGQNVLTQLLAGAASSPELRAGLMNAFQPWMDLVEQSVDRVLGTTPYANVVKTEDLTFAITSLFLGIELMNTLDPDKESALSLFNTFETLATVIEALLRVPAPEPAKSSPKKRKKKG
jgi:AcrR family transcriptional regulator